MRWTGWIASIAMAGVLFASGSGDLRGAERGDDAPAAAMTVRAPTTSSAHVATLRRAVVARAAPSPTARARTVVRPTTTFAGVGATLLVTRGAVRGGDLWVEVMLPVRPNGSRGWIPADAVSLSTTPYRITIDLSDRRLTLYRADRVVMRTPIAVGAPGTPTPTGRFAITERVDTRTPGAFLGPVVLPITGFSRTLNEFAGGDGRVALHGTSLPALIGTRASHGCVRLRNADVVRLAARARAGTPVIIRP